MSHAKARLNRGARPKYLGVKLYSGQKAELGQVIVRQRGTKVLPGENIKKGRQNTLYALKSGIIEFTTKRIRSFDNSQRKVKIVSVKSKDKE